MRKDTLAKANAALLVAIGLHGADHLSQERGIGALTTEVRVGGAIVAVLAVVSLVLAARDHPRAPSISAFAGFYIASGVLASHFAPHWSALSDPYEGLGLGALSWAAAGLEVLMALVVGVLGVRSLRRNRPHAVATG
jgi:hypothetical protein